MLGRISSYSSAHANHIQLEIVVVAHDGVMTNMRTPPGATVVTRQLGV